MRWCARTSLDAALATITLESRKLVVDFQGNVAIHLPLTPVLISVIGLIPIGIRRIKFSELHVSVNCRCGDQRQSWCTVLLGTTVHALGIVRVTTLQVQCHVLSLYT